jgi:hypothetical protein
MRILDRLPIYQEPTIIAVQREVAQVWRNQIVVWVSVNDATRPFPAILDTGHSHNFALTHRQLLQWSGAELRQIGEATVDRETVPQFAADVHIHCNLPGRHGLRGNTYLLAMDQGISVMPDGHIAAPRLPLLGLRAILSNRLSLRIDGKRRRVTLRTQDWLLG